MMRFIIAVYFVSTVIAEYSKMPLHGSSRYTRSVNSSLFSPNFERTKKDLEEISNDSIVCKKNFMSLFIEEQFGVSLKKPVLATQNMNFYCPDLRYTCCNENQLNFLTIQFLKGVEQTQIQQKNLENTIDLLREIGKDALLDHSAVLGKEDQKYLQSNVQKVFESFEELISRSKQFNDLLNSFYSAFACQICDSLSNFYDNNYLKDNDEYLISLSVHYKSIALYFNLLYLNLMMVKTVQDIQRVLLPFASKSLQFYAELAPLQDPSKLDEEARRYFNCWKLLVRRFMGEAETTACLKEVESKNLAFRFDDYGVANHLMLIAKILIQDFKIPLGKFAAIEPNMIGRRVQYGSNEKKVQAFSAKYEFKMKASFQKGALDSRKNTLNPLFWKHSSIRTVLATFVILWMMFFG